MAGRCNWFYLLFFFSLFPFLPSPRKSLGTVKDAEDKPIPSVTVSIKGKPAATNTSANGQFTIQARVGDTLQFTSINYDPVTQVVGDKDEYSIILNNKVSKLDDVIVIGYGTVQKRDVTGSVSKAPVEDMQKAPVRSLMKRLPDGLPE